jgi:hypothetical protein
MVGASPNLLKYHQISRFNPARDARLLVLETADTRAFAVPVQRLEKAALATPDISRSHHPGRHFANIR